MTCLISLINLNHTDLITFLKIFIIFLTQVVGTGLWVPPGDSEEVAAALSQSLKNSLERLFIFFSML